MTHTDVSFENANQPTPSTDSTCQTLSDRLIEFESVIEDFTELAHDVIRPSLMQALVDIGRVSTDVDVRFARQCTLDGEPRNYAALALTLSVQPTNPRSAFHCERRRLSFEVQLGKSGVTVRDVWLDADERVRHSTCYCRGIAVGDLTQSTVEEMVNRFLSQFDLTIEQVRVR